MPAIIMYSIMFHSSLEGFHAGRDSVVCAPTLATSHGGSLDGGVFLGLGVSAYPFRGVPE